MPASVPPGGETDPATVSEAGRTAATEALHAAFARLAPQGSDPWNFTGAFNQLADRYGPDHPGTSATADALVAGDRTSTRGGRLRRRAGAPPTQGGSKTETEEAMAVVVEAFRWLAARVSTLEERLSREDRPLDGPAWLAPAADLGELMGPVADLIRGETPGGEVLHADCGSGALLAELRRSGVPAAGAEPRGAIALRALEDGYAVSICEAADALVARPAASLGGLVLSGVVDRLPLHALVTLLAQARTALAPGAPIVVVSHEGAQAASEAGTVPASAELTVSPSLHAETWKLLLERAGFEGASTLDVHTGPQGRVATAAVVPR